MCSKSISTEAVFTKTEKNNEWNMNFLLSKPLVILASFQQVEAAIKIFFDSVWSCTILFFNASHILKFYPVDEFSV